MIKEIFQEVSEILDDYQSISYHIFCNVVNEDWSPNLDSVSFTVSFWNDKDDSTWKEDWKIDNEGIHTEKETYKTISDFKAWWG